MLSCHNLKQNEFIIIIIIVNLCSYQKYNYEYFFFQNKFLISVQVTGKSILVQVIPKQCVIL